MSFNALPIARSAAYIGGAFLLVPWTIKAAQAVGFGSLACGNAAALYAANKLPKLQNPDRQRWVENVKKIAETNRDHYLNKTKEIETKHLARDLIGAVALITLGLMVELYDSGAGRNMIDCREFTSANEAEQFIAGYYHTKKYTNFNNIVTVKACREGPRSVLDFLEAIKLSRVVPLEGMKEMTAQLLNNNATALRDAFLKFNYKEALAETAQKSLPAS